MWEVGISIVGMYTNRLSPRFKGIATSHQAQSSEEPQLPGAGVIIPSSSIYNLYVIKYFIRESRNFFQKDFIVFYLYIQLFEK